jgi:LysR family transcriptional regulator, glycine cleavage system transcriptional activator
MKRSRLPLTALRAFEVAGRHQSFTKAADELTVSEAAISRQVRDLERLLGTALFVRGHRSVRLNESGAWLLAQLTSSFDAIDAALSGLTISTSPKEVLVSVEPTFAGLFLIPRLAAFSTSHPDIDVQIDSNSELVDVSAGGPTLAIRHSLTQSSWPRSKARHLFDNALTPMASPALTAPRLQTPNDLAKVRLLRDENGEAWIRWLTDAGFTGTPIWGPVFSHAASAIQSAELGHGVALGNRQLAARLLENNSLYAPFEHELGSGAYWLVAKDFGNLTMPETVFCEWLLDELREARDKVRQNAE